MRPDGVLSHRRGDKWNPMKPSYAEPKVEKPRRSRNWCDGALAVGRLRVTVSNSEQIVPNDRGFWYQTKKGLSTSFVAASWSLNFIIIGLCVLLPWALLAWGGVKIYRRVRRKPATTA